MCIFICVGCRGYTRFFTVGRKDIECECNLFISEPPRERNLCLACGTILYLSNSEKKKVYECKRIA